MSPRVLPIQGIDDRAAPLRIRSSGAEESGGTEPGTPAQSNDAESTVFCEGVCTKPSGVIPSLPARILEEARAGLAGRCNGRLLVQSVHRDIDLHSRQHPPDLAQLAWVRAGEHEWRFPCFHS